jgi:hypothetical protein
VVTQTRFDIARVKPGLIFGSDGNELFCTIHVGMVLKAEGGPAMRVRAGSDLTYRECGGQNIRRAARAFLYRWRTGGIEGHQHLLGYGCAEARGAK